MASLGSSLLRRVSAFGGLSMVGAVSPLLVLPVIARAVSPGVWASLLSCQAVGAFAGLLILSGWGVNGQAHAAVAASSSERDAIYRASVGSRLKLGAVVLPLCAGLGLAMSNGAMPVTHVLMCVSASWSGFTLNWFAVGAGRPSWIAGYEVFPRLSAAAASAAVILVTGAVWVYPVTLLVLLIVGLTCFHLREFDSWLPAGATLPPTLGLAERLRGAALSLVGAAYSSAPVPIAHVLSLSGAPALASTDRLYRYALVSVSSLANALQQWVLGDRTRSSAHVTALRLHLVLGLLGAAGISSLGPTVGRFLFGNDVAPSYAICGGYAVAFLFVSVGTPLWRNVLVPANRTDAVLRATIVSGVVAVLLMAATGRAVGAAGVSWSLACGDFLFFMLTAPIARRLLKEEAVRGSDD